MKPRTILVIANTIIFLMLPFLLFAQESTKADSTKADRQNWKFAVGVTLFGNTQYSSYQTRQPLTLNFRYALKDRHMLRMNIPIARNEKTFGDSNGSIFPAYSSPEALAKKILKVN